MSDVEWHKHCHKSQQLEGRKGKKFSNCWFHFDFFSLRSAEWITSAEGNFPIVMTTSEKAFPSCCQCNDSIEKRERRARGGERRKIYQNHNPFAMISWILQDGGRKNSWSLKMSRTERVERENSKCIDFLARLNTKFLIFRKKYIFSSEDAKADTHTFSQKFNFSIFPTRNPIRTVFLLEFAESIISSRGEEGERRWESTFVDYE